ncbi:hypothetical protein BJ138DRAFT_1121016 [Hygrophoropsis aurantiaca]|uniref:Uncharacterized protein n=1 Tax=Hygrophoropsis aurantiaca TaxID=72124 RepID=A0ACB7ZQ09_9AGAM|nr:hypothetical protein BJ138DRAFT_1121016 [Hygrophoropsis aurantiaca]
MTNLRSNVYKVEALYKAITAGEVHLASEATVAAIGMLCDSSRVYAAQPILVSGTCKCKAAEPHAALITNIVRACNDKVDKVKGRLLSIASDGEARRGAALVMLTQRCTLSSSSNIYQLLRGLHLMNLLVGDDDVTADKGYKHVFKRLRNLLLREKGTVINGFHITTSLLSVHLRTDGMPPHCAAYLLNPNDKQDVVLALMLLKAIWELRDPIDTDTPAFTHARRHIKILGSFFFYLVAPYIQVTLSLHQQLVYLSAAAHLLLSLYSNAGNKFVPKILYNDIQIMIKNVYFCVAKVKADHPSAQFWILLLGTNRLEIAFGIYCTMIGNDANTNILQLSGQIASVSEASRILAKYSQWDHGPR